MQRSFLQSRGIQMSSAYGTYVNLKVFFCALCGSLLGIGALRGFQSLC
jgi:hypothetical protein